MILSGFTLHLLKIVSDLFPSRSLLPFWGLSAFPPPPPTERGEKEHTLCIIYNLSLRLVKHTEQAAFAVNRPGVYACLASFAPRTPALLRTLDKNQQEP